MKQVAGKLKREIYVYLETKPKEVGLDVRKMWRNGVDSRKLEEVYVFIFTFVVCLTILSVAQTIASDG
jgi:hypothetical protein